MFYLDIALLLFILIIFPIQAQKTESNFPYVIMTIFLLGIIFRIVSYLRKERAKKSS